MQPINRYRVAVTRYDGRLRLLATCLSALAGYVDALAFVELGGFFVSFMSGNSTRLGVGAIEAAGHASLAASLILLFVAGVAAGSLVRHHLAWMGMAGVLLLVAAFLTCAASAASLGFTSFAIAAMAIAMGAENAAFEQDGEVRIGLTYMTGSLVKLGQGIAGAMLGRGHAPWSPYLLLWLGFVLGAALGAALHPRWGLDALWGAALAAILLTLAAAKLRGESRA